MHFPVGSWERLTAERIREARGLIFRLQYRLGRVEMQLAALRKMVEELSEQSKAPGGEPVP